MKAPDLEEMVAESEAVSAIFWNVSIARALQAQVRLSSPHRMGGKLLLDICKRAVPPSANRQREADLLFGYVAGRYVELYGEPLEVPYVKTKWGEQCAETYFELDGVQAVVKEMLRGT